MNCIDLELEQEKEPLRYSKEEAFGYSEVAADQHPLGPALLSY
jgi:hypothetical protein